MKRLSKKLIALVMAMTMVLAMGVTSFAAETTTNDTCTVTFTINRKNGDEKTALVSDAIVVEVPVGQTVKTAVETKLSAYYPHFTDVENEDGEYQYSYLDSMKFGSETLASAGTSTPSVPGDWTHGTYEGWDWEYYVNNVYAQDYMSSHVITGNCTIELDYAYNSFSW